MSQGRQSQIQSQSDARRAGGSSSQLASGSNLRFALPASDGNSVDLAPIHALPRQHLIAVEYPGILKDANSLESALISLDPTPPPYATARRALVELGRSVSQGRIFVECRLGAGEVQREVDAERCGNMGAKGKAKAVLDDDGDESMLDLAEATQTTTDGELDEPSTTAETSSSKAPRSTEIFRHPLIGDLTTSFNPVCRLRKRVWRRPKPGGGPDEFEERKEYTYEFLGTATKTARFRSMADFSYEPDLEGAAGGEAKPAGTLELFEALARMDADALLNHTFGREQELFEVGDGSEKRSNLQLPPPPLFNLQTSPFLYGYRQNPSSALVPASAGSSGIGPLRRDGTRAMSRFDNRLRAKGLAPTQFGFSRGWSGKVPERPSEALEQYRKEAKAGLLERLKQLFEERPVWTKTALRNHLKPEWRRDVVNKKYYYSLSAYAMTDGPWRDCLIRFGYDPRKHQEARFLQKVVCKAQSGKGGESRGPLERGRFKASHGIAQPGDDGDAPGARLSAERGEQEGEGEGEAEGERERGEQGEDEAEMEPEPEQEDEGTPAGNDENTNSHIFDGEHLAPEIGTFQLCDITDPELKGLIDTDDICDTVDMVSGFYSELAWERIRAVFAVRFYSLKNDKSAADHAKVKAALDGVKARSEMVEAMAAQQLAQERLQQQEGAQQGGDEMMREGDENEDDDAELPELRTSREKTSAEAQAEQAAGDGGDAGGAGGSASRGGRTRNGRRGGGASPAAGSAGIPSGTSPAHDTGMTGGGAGVRARRARGRGN